MRPLLAAGLNSGLAELRFRELSNSEIPQTVAHGRFPIVLIPREAENAIGNSWKMGTWDGRGVMG